MRNVVLLAVVVSAGCLRKTEYKCSDNTQCGTGGQCEAAGYCSFEDSMCTSGRRYADLAGSSYSGKCVGEVTGEIDSGVDGPTDDGGIDAMVDANPGNCPATYTTVIGTHLYRVVATSTNWNNQRNDCGDDTAGTNTYLASPDDQTELTAIIAAAAQTRIWVGVNDTTEGTYAKTGGGTIPSNDPMWDTLEPDDNPVGGGGGAGDCVSAGMTSGKIADDNCATSYRAVCECEP